MQWQNTWNLWKPNQSRNLIKKPNTLHSLSDFFIASNKIDKNLEILNTNQLSNKIIWKTKSSVCMYEGFLLPIQRRNSQHMTKPSLFIYEIRVWTWLKHGYMCNNCSLYIHMKRHHFCMGVQCLHQFCNNCKHHLLFEWNMPNKCQRKYRNLKKSTDKYTYSNEFS